MSKLKKFFAASIIIIIGAVSVFRYRQLVKQDRALSAKNSSLAIDSEPPASSQNLTRQDASQACEVANRDASDNAVTKPKVHRSNDGIYPCKSYFFSIDQIIINFFRRENFDEQISLLLSASPPEYINLQLNKLAKYHNHEESNMIKNKLISKVIRIEKVSVDQVKIDEFLKRISRVQKYFYSSAFIDICQP